MRALGLSLMVWSLAAPVQAGECAISRELKSDSQLADSLERARKQLGLKPHALMHLHTEGTLPHQGIRDESLEAELDFPRMHDAALAWRQSGDQRFLQQVDAYLVAWTALYVPSFNPIDETRFDDFIAAYALTRQALPVSTVDATQKFLRTLAEGYIERAQSRRDPTHGPGSGVWVNNWQSHRIKLMALGAAALQDRSLMVRAQKLFAQQIENNVQPDGSVRDFAERDALHYVVYDLEPLGVAALAAWQFDLDWLHARTPDGLSLASAIDWLMPYADGTREHMEFVNTRQAFDRKRAAAGVAGFSGAWNPEGATTLYWQAAAQDSKYLPIAEKLSPQPPVQLAWLCSVGGTGQDPR